MKVFHLIDSGGFFGAERVLLTLAEQQILNGYDVTVVSYGSVGLAVKQIESECEKLNIPVLKWRGLAYSNLATLIKKNIDAVFHSHGYKFNIFLALIRLKNKKIFAVSTVHGYTNAPLLSKLNLYYIANKVALRLLTGNVFVSKVTARVSHIRLTEKNVVIHNGIASQLPLRNKEQFTFDGGEYLVAVGRLSPEKSYDKLILAFNLICKKYENLSLVIIGDGPERDKLINCSTGNPRVLFKGHMSNPIPLIESARALVISSSSEGLPIVLLEAMRAGVDIVSTSVGAIADVITDGSDGVLCEAGSESALANAIDSVLQNEKGCFGSVAKRKFQSDLTAQRMFSNYDAWYKNVVAK
ncbi:glycosyltransferase [Cellvibrio fontiphilus]|jgi:glycosyltransferase involved in cell wall biosynthesis|uniref:Glycosyltransferase n=1 Tax=Cellvibrio fontiphilus TaxID=1815559 RepID=A0ABV7FBT5_9GAMM